MKKKWTVSILLFVMLFITVSLFTQERQTLPVKLEKIVGNLFVISGGRGANGGLYIGDNGVLVIDAKMNKESVEQTLAEIGKLTDKPITYLVNTHSDGDHIQGNQYFPKTVKIVSHQNCREEFFHTRWDGSESIWNDPELAPFIPSITFREQLDLYLGSKKVELWYFGVGHTTGDAFVYFPEEKTVFVGDQLFFGRPQLIHSYKGGNSFEYMETMTKMLETLDAERFCSGHDEPVDRRKVQAHIQKMKKMQNKVKMLVEKDLHLDKIKNEFKENEARLVEVIFHEITGSE
jgi:glyoxylase-like metal-dependent hydrolase (beta-lactamase superfamily II)